MTATPSPSLPAGDDHAASSMNTRQCVIDRKVALRTLQAEAYKEARGLPNNSPEKNRLFREIQEHEDEGRRLEALLETRFMPQHGPLQLLSPRAFFVSPLFRVASKRLTRQRDITLEMNNPHTNGKPLRYTGPELRQSDGMVFMALLNLVRDVRVGERVSFTAEQLCRASFGRYDGPTRNLLRDHIKRLQRGLVEFEEFSVQLCLRFEYPKRGEWSVALDRDIVQLFRNAGRVWLDLPTRQALPEGLSTWLYGYVRSQARLIPTSIETLREMCGSDATADSFQRTLRVALKELTAHGVLDDGWTMKGGVVHWRKKAAEEHVAKVQIEGSAPMAAGVTPSNASSAFPARTLPLFPDPGAQS